MPYDVHVVGGGPAGCFAGIAACLDGKKVLLSEEHNKIGEPEACSGLISKSGLEALREIKTHEGLRRIPVIVFTTSKQDEDVVKSYDEGANSFLMKPIKFGELVKLLDTFKKYWLETSEIPDGTL